MAGGIYVGDAQLDANKLAAAQRNEYVQAAAADPDTSLEVKLAMVWAQFYESSMQHVGYAYVDRNGRGQPLTVCAGITGPEVLAGKWYTPNDCYELEKRRYLEAERVAPQHLRYWSSYDPFARATFLDFLHNKGAENFSTSTMKRKANAGDLAGACRENPRWNKGTVNGARVVLPGLQIRGDANSEICSSWRLQEAG
ncbi:lysozyme [Lampropedia aestuarii]|uniref:Lysozyme n=2 Tax=Lampropedia aestuarii TaxID=2562762 RepID=A0A4V3YWT8_9BURK|nr:lysozyme [Lampropedia aestuarii]